MNMVKKLLFLLLLPLSAVSQKLETDRYDKYLKTHIKETACMRLDMKFAEVLAGRLRKVDATYSLGLSMSFPSVFRVDKGDRATFLFDDESTITLECFRGGVANYNYSKYSSYWNGRYLYKVTETDLSHFQTHFLVGIRTSLGNEYQEWAVKEKHARMFQKGAEIIGE